jgi:hypothetical protein
VCPTTRGKEERSKKMGGEVDSDISGVMVALIYDIAPKKKG